MWDGSGGGVVSMSWFEDTTNTSQIIHTRTRFFVTFPVIPKKFPGHFIIYTFFGGFDPSYEKKIL